MAIKKIRHAIFEWFDADGTRHYAFRGDVVDVPDHVVEAFAKFEPFEGDTAAAPAAAPVLEQAPVDSPVNPATAGELERPKKTAPVKVWEDYVVGLFEQSEGKTGLNREDAEKSSKQELIELFGE